MNKDTDGGLQPGRDPDDIDAAQAALNRMRDAAAARGEIRRAVAALRCRQPKTRPRGPGNPRVLPIPRHRPGSAGPRKSRGTPRGRTRLELAGGRRLRHGAVGRAGGPGDLGALHSRRVLPTPPCMCGPIPRLGQPSCGCSAAACWKNSGPSLATASSPASRCSDPPPRAGARASGRSTAGVPATRTDSPGPWRAPDLKHFLQKPLKNPQAACRALERSRSRIGTLGLDPESLAGGASALPAALSRPFGALECRFGPYNTIESV